MNTSPAPSLLLTALSAFQAGLAAGASWGPAAYGGQHPGVLPARLRVISGAASLLCITGAGALASHRTSPSARRRILRGCVGFAALGTVTNAVSRSSVGRLWAVWGLALGAVSLRELRRIPHDDAGH